MKHLAGDTVGAPLCGARIWEYLTPRDEEADCDECLFIRIATLRTAVTDLLAALEAQRHQKPFRHLGECVCDYCSEADRHNAAIARTIDDIRKKTGL